MGKIVNACLTKTKIKSLNAILCVLTSMTFNFQPQRSEERMIDSDILKIN